MTRADQGKLVSKERVKREKLGNFKGIRFGADGFEGSADFQGRIRLHIPEVNVAGAAEIEDHDAGPLLMPRLHHAGFRCVKILRQRKPQGREGTHGKKFTPRARRATERDFVTGRIC